MINSTNDILNFRYKSKHLTWNWSNLARVIPRSNIIETLKLQPLVYKQFKLVIDENGSCHINEDSKTNDVFFYTTYHVNKKLNITRVPNLQNIITNHPFEFNNLVCAGDDTFLSVIITYLQEIKHLFKKIYYEAKDIECDWVTTIPMGTIMAYMLRCGGDQILHHINKPKNKTKLIGWAFGSKWPKNTERIWNRVKLKHFTKNSELMDNMFCDPLEYFEKLSDYKFFACPLGNGIQTPKICESILCETVPVVTNHIAHRELRDIYDLPLLIVDKWSDLTEELLNEAYENKFKYINWQKEKSKFLVENFQNLLK